MSRWLLVALGVFLVLFGIFSVVPTFQIELGKPIMGFAALVAGAIALFQALSGRSAG